MELYSFLVMLVVTNVFFMIREITIVVQHSKDPHVTTLEVSSQANSTEHSKQISYCPASESAGPS